MSKPLAVILLPLLAALAGCASLRNDPAGDGGTGGRDGGQDGTPDRAGVNTGTGGTGPVGSGGAGAGSGGSAGNGGGGSGGDSGGAGAGGGGVAGSGGAMAAGSGGGAMGGMGGAPSGVNRSLTLQVMGRGRATGSIRISSPPMSCASQCTTMIAQGTEVTLTAEPAAGYWLEGWSGACASEARTGCTLTLTSDQTVTAIFTPANVAFVSSTTRVVANLGGVAGADAICLERARAANLTGQSWKAWLATPTIAPRTRFASARGWVRPDGKPFADKIEDLTGQTNRGLVWFYPPKLDESGREIPKGNIASCAAEGKNFCTSGPTCGPAGQEYTANVGTLCWGQTDHSWELAGTCGDGCGQAMHVLCLGTDYKAMVTLPAAPAGAKIAFVGGTLKGNATVAGADALCASAASNAGLAGTFQALITPTGASAASRFTLSAGPYHRPDGLPIAATANDLFMGRITAPIIQFADGRYINGTNPALTGGTTPFEVGVDANNCKNFTSNAPADRMITGAPMGTNTNVYNEGFTSCSTDYYWSLCMQK